MRFFGKGGPQTWHILGLGLILTLLFAVACGSAAAPQQAAPADTSAPAPVEITTSSEAPTAVPQVMSEPGDAMSQIHPGNVTFMVAAWGDERFDRTFSGGASNSYGRILHGFLIEATERRRN